MNVDGITALAAFLNAHNGAEQPEMSMQMLKLAEEVGEVAQAWIGYTGQNPRKGVTHSLEDVRSELADVAITAMVGIARLGGDPATVVGAKADVMAQRYAAVEEATPMPALRPAEFGPAYHGVHLHAHEDDWGWTAYGHHEPRRVAAACVAHARTDGVLDELREAEIGLGDLLAGMEARWAVRIPGSQDELEFCDAFIDGAIPVTVVVP